MRILPLILLGLSSAALAQAPVQSGGSVPPPPKPVSKEDKVICRTTPEIGSLVATNKVCKTRREWTRINDNLRDRGPVGGCAGGGGPAGGSCQY